MVVSYCFTVFEHSFLFTWMIIIYTYESGRSYGWAFNDLPKEMQSVRRGP